MTNLNLTDYALKDDTLKECDSARKVNIKVNFKVLKRDSKVTFLRGFVNKPDGSMVANHWTCFWFFPIVSVGLPINF